MDSDLDEEPHPAERYLFEQRALIGRFLEALNYSNYGFVAGVSGFPYEEVWMHPNRSLTIELGGRSVGYLGTLHPRISKNFEGLGRQVWLGELDLDALKLPEKAVTLFKTLPRFPAIPFDLSLEVPTAMRAAELVERESALQCF